MLPVDVVTEILMLNLNYRDDDNCVDMCVSTDPLVVLSSGSMSGIRSKIRTYLQSLIPPPVLLSECEEGKDFYVRLDGRILPMRRVGGKAYHPLDVLNHWMPICPASQCVVIQPVEVNRDWSA